MKPFVKNWSMLIFSDVVGYGFGFLSTILLARNLNPAGYGTYNVILAISAMAAIVANIGMTQVMTREISRRHEIAGLLFRKLLWLRLTASLAAIIGVVLYYLFFGSETGWVVIIFTSVYTLCLTGWDLAESIAFGWHVMKYSAGINSVATAIWFVLLWIAPKEYYSVLTVLSFFTLVNVVKVAVYYFLLSRGRLLTLQPATEVPRLREMVKMSLPYLWLWGFGTIGNQIPILLLFNNSGDTQVGIFSIGSRLIIPLTLLTGTATRAIFPNLSRIAMESREKFQRIIADGTRVVIFVGSLGAAVLSLLSPFLVPLLFGETYRGAVAPFNLLVWYGVFYSVDVVFGTALSSSDKQNLMAILATVDTIAALPFIYWASFHGAYWLAGAKLGVEAVLMLYRWVVFKNILGPSFHPVRWILMMGFLVVVGLVSLLPAVIPLWLQAGIIALLALAAWTIPHSPFHSLPSTLFNYVMRKEAGEAVEDGSIRHS